MADKAKFAFGSLANLQAALDAGKVDPYDLLCLMDNGVARIGWIDKHGNPVIINPPEEEVIAVDALPTVGASGVLYIVGKEVYIWHGNEFVLVSESTDLSEIESRIETLEADMLTKANSEAVDVKVSKAVTEVTSTANAYTDKKFLEALDLSVHEKYEITNVPNGTLVDYRKEEIRVMCPANTVFTRQNVGEGGDANMYYMAFRAYAPEGAVSFKEDDMASIEDQTMYYFEGNDFAGVDKLGRKYSVVWLALAHYDVASGTWTYFGKNSTADRYIGWYYSVEWYDANGTVIDSDRIRINLSNEDCHLNVEPFYIAEVKKAVNSYTDEQIENKITEIVEIPVVEF